MALGLRETIPELKEKKDESDVSSVSISPGAPPASNTVGPTSAARFTDKTRCVVYGKVLSLTSVIFHFFLTFYLVS